MAKKNRIGVVLSNKMDKTVVVDIQRKYQHPLYKKYVRTNKNYKAHDENNECQIGDTVKIEETRPLSKHKSWKVVEVVEKAVK